MQNARGATRAPQGPHLNLFTQFDGSDPSEYYFRGVNNHWDGHGQDVAAAPVKEYMMANALLESR